MKNFKFFPQVQQGLKIGLINLVVLFVLLEIGSLIFYYSKHQQFYYTRERTEDLQNLGVNLEGVRVGESIVERLHPYFGYIQKPGTILDRDLSIIIMGLFPLMITPTPKPITIK